MTTSVKVSVPEGAPWKAVMKVVDYNLEGSEGNFHTEEVLPGQTVEIYLHGTRRIHSIKEENLPPKE